MQLANKKYYTVANNFLKENFDLKLNIPIQLNGRLKRALGTYYQKYDNNELIPSSINLSKNLFEYHDESTIIDVLKHELIHYALHVKGLPYDDNDYEFINTCNRLGVSLTNTIKYKGKIHVFSCKCEGKEFLEKRKFKNGTYRCKKCKGDLNFKETRII